MLLRPHRDLSSARACFVLPTYRRRFVPEEVITDKHPAYVRAVRDVVLGTLPMRHGLHRAFGPDTKPINWSHVSTKDRLRPMHGHQSIRTAHRPPTASTRRRAPPPGRGTLRAAPAAKRSPRSSAHVNFASS